MTSRSNIYFILLIFVIRTFNSDEKKRNKIPNNQKGEKNNITYSH